MAQRCVRRRCAKPVLLAVPILAVLALIPACWDTDSLGGLFGEPPGTGGDGGFEPGIGGGVELRDLFEDARLLREPPTIVRTAPAHNATNVSVKSPIVVEFSESMTESSVTVGINLFQRGATTATAVTTTLFVGDSVAVLVPQVDLLAGTDYDIVVAGTVSDLQGDNVDSSGAGSLRFGFSTIESTGDPDFEVIFSSPPQQGGEVPRGADTLLVFSEPFNAATTGGGLHAPGNLVARRNGTTLTLGTDYIVTTSPSANPRIVEIDYTVRAAAAAAVQVVVDSDVQSADGQETLLGGQGFDLSYTAQGVAVPDDVLFPGSPVVTGFDGVIRSVDLHQHAADVDLTSDGEVPDTTTLVYFDAVQRNALLFSTTGADPTSFVSDLEPDVTPALLDGDVLVGAFVERRGFRSEVSVLEIVAKDTIGPRLLAMGPPAVTPTVLVTHVNDPVLHGRTTEPCQGIQVDFDGAGSADFNSVVFVPGISTVTEDLFVTGATEDAPLPDQLERSSSFSFITADVFGNLSVNADSIQHQTAGKVGAQVAAPDGVTALFVVAYAADIFQQFVGGGAVLLDAFPPEASGASQIVKDLTSSSGVVSFTDAELATIPTSQVTITIVARRGVGGGSSVVFGPLTFMGIDKPTAAAPRAVIARLDPDPSIDLTGRVQCDILSESQGGSSILQGSSFTVDTDATTPELEKILGFVGAPGINDNILDLPFNLLHAFSVIERTPVGATSRFRWTSSEPFTPDAAGGGFGLPPVREVNFGDQISFEEGTHPHLVHAVTFDNDDVIGGGPLGLLGGDTTAEQLRELRIVSRIPGFAAGAAIAAESGFVPDGVDPTLRTGEVLLPLPLLENNTPAGGAGFEDTALELLLQPDLIDPASAVDPAPLRRNLRVELFVQDRLVAGGTTATAAYTRERFIFDPTAATVHTAVLQAIPVITVDVASHPPALSWPEVTGGEGMHTLVLKGPLTGQTWTLHVPALSGGGPVSVQLPKIPGALPDGVGAIDFSFPGTFPAFVESFDFDPDHLFDATSTEQYHFDPQSWWQTDLERECLRSSRSDPNATITSS